MYGQSWTRRVLGCVRLLVPMVALSAGTAAAQVVDTTPPTITAAATTVPNANGWYRANVRVRFTCADPGGRIAVCPAAVVVSSEGANQTISGTARDRAGNTASASVTLNIDKTAPAVTVSRAPEAPASGWSTTPVTVTFAATDALSGLAPDTLTAPLTLATDRTNGSATGRATDLAGNVGTVKLTGINIDQRAPRITVTLSPVPALRGFRTGAVTAHFTCTDARSGVAACPPDQQFPDDGAGQTVTGTATDVAGLSATVTKSFNIDSTAPVIQITAPTDSYLPGATTTITGTVADPVAGVLSLMFGARRLRLGAGGSFTSGPLTLIDGLNTFTLVATDRAGNVRSHTVRVWHGCTNLIADPGFEAGESGFEAQDESSLVARTTESPLEGASSLRLSITGYGNNLWWVHDFSGGRASAFRASARLRSDLNSSSVLRFCAMAYYVDGSTALNCTPVSGAAGDKGTVNVALTLDSTKPLETVRIRMVQEGSDPVSFTMDSASACMDVVEQPPDDDPEDPDPDPPVDPVCSASAPGEGAYPGFTYQLPTVRPFISLNDYANPAPAPLARFRAAADAALAGNPPYAYNATHSVMMYRLTGQVPYLADAIARVDAFVTAAEADIAAGNAPDVAGDSYLEVGWYLEQLALTFDYGHAALSPEQQLRWAAFADQTLYNLWHPEQAAWGGTSHHWTGWSICDPGNNYHYSFLRGTMLWALATQNTAWFDFLQTQKFGPLMDYFAAVPGGGSLEGTGYGTAQKSLFENYVYWKASTGEDLAGITPHTRETIDYWVHATVPTRDRFAPIGDQSRSSIPDLYDFHENLVHAAVVLSAGTPQAGRGTWWLQHNSVNGVAHSFNLAGDLLPYPDAPLAPTDLVYRAAGAGVLFARSSWATDAAWLSFMAGKYDQSHAHQDQGSFTFFKGDWLAVTSNIWSHSGINQNVEVHNVIRFERPNGTTIEQDQSSTVQSSMVFTSGPGTMTATADLANAYSKNRTSILSWTRTLELIGTDLRVTDTCGVAAGVRPIFQLQVPATPVLQEDGSILAGPLRIVPQQPVNVAVVTLGAPEFTGGYRIELTANTGCGFSVLLQPQ